jgi:hypothetical protein
VDDIFAALQSQSDAWQKLQDYQRRNRIDIRYDLATPLGSEFLFALDGPLLPFPSWKIVIEVKDAARLQNALEWSVNEANREAATNHTPAIALTAETSGGLTLYTMSSSEFPTEIHYTFWMGYLIVAPNRTLLMEAMQYRNTGTSLGRSQLFRSQLPADGRDDASGIVYQNITAIAESVPIGGVRQMVGDGVPMLICLYGQPDRILMSSKGVLGTNIASLAGLSGMANMIRRR